MMTSMIDVVFLLLIFFVCAATGQLRESLLPANLQAGSVESQAPVETPVPRDEIRILLTTDAGGQTVMQLNGTTYESFAALQAVLTALAEIAPENPVILDVAPRVPAGDMIRVYDTCRAGGFESIHFQARRPKPAQPPR